jgi:hypothetical protein
MQIGITFPGRADGEDSDGYWWWQSTEARAAKWVVPQWEVLAAGIEWVGTGV